MDQNTFDDDIQEEGEDYRVTLDLDDGRTIECAIMTILESDGRDYIVLVPVDENEEPMESGEVYIYRYIEDEDGNPGLENIYDDEEFERVSDRFDEYLDEEEFESM